MCGLRFPNSTVFWAKPSSKPQKNAFFFLENCRSSSLSSNLKLLSTNGLASNFLIVPITHTTILWSIPELLLSYKSSTFLRLFGWLCCFFPHFHSIQFVNLVRPEYRSLAQKIDDRELFSRISSGLSHFQF